MVRAGTAGAGPQRAKPAKKEKVDGGCRRADRRPTVELQCSRRESDVVRGKQTPLEHRQHVHQLAEGLRARRALLCRRPFKSFPDESGGAEHNSGARRWNHMGQNAFRRSLGTIITTDRTTGSQDQRVGRDDGGARPVERRHHGERCAWCRLLSVVGPSSRLILREAFHFRKVPSYE